MSLLITEFVKTLRGVKNVDRHCRRIEEWAAAGEAGTLYQAALALEAERTKDGIEGWAADSVQDRILRTLALTPHREFVVAALRLCSAGQQQHGRFTAQLLASGQALDTLFALFEHAGDEEAAHQETLACVLQEIVLRGTHAPENFPAVVRHFHERLHGQNHPLGWLPLSLAPPEVNLRACLRTYQLNGSSCSLPFGPEAAAQSDQPFESAAVPSRRIVEETTNPAWANQVGVAVANWEQESNGKTEARAFTVKSALSANDVLGPFLLSLDLTCLAGVRPDDVHLRVATPAEALEVLFSASANGGAYNSGRYGAYGRLEAWQSLAGLAGAAIGETFDAVSSRVESCAWWRFEANADWFYQIAWDLGLVALSPSGHAIHVLAATDTD